MSLNVPVKTPFQSNGANTGNATGLGRFGSLAQLGRFT